MVIFILNVLSNLHRRFLTIEVLVYAYIKSYDTNEMNNPEIAEGALTPRGHPKCKRVIQGYQLAAFMV